MGNQQQYGKSVETFLLKYLPQLNYKLTLKDDSFKYLENEVNKIRSVFSLHKHPNVLVYDKIFNVQKKALLGIRQFVCHNLKEKLHRIPKLAMIEKKWLVFQLLCAVSQIHSEKMVHGDIKPSNIELTSYNWLFITDQVPYKPAFLGEDDLKQYNLYFGELDNNLRCYIAPERFRADSLEEQFDNNFLEPSMDIFSAGCVIAEIFMDGHPLFDLAQLQNYRKKLYDPRDDLSKKIKDPKIVDLIMSMIHRDPYKRASIPEYILRWNKDVFPRSFHQIYFQLASTYVRPQYMFSDMKISLIRKYINSVWFSCFGKRNASVTENFSEPIEPFVFERIRDDTIKEFETYLVPSNELFVFLSKQNLQAMYESLAEDQYRASQEDKDSIIVAVHWIGSLITSCFYPQSRCCGLEMLYKMAIESAIEIRLQFILPYVLQMFEDENSKVKAKAIEVAVMMFADILDQAYLTTLTATDYKVFDNYILPAFLKLKNESTKDQYVQHIFVRYLPLLAQIGHRFLELSIGSKFQKRQMNKNTNQGQQLVEEGKADIGSEQMAGASQQTDDSNSFEEEQDRMFSQHENLLASTAHHHTLGHRNTVIIRDDKQQEKVNQQNQHRHYQDVTEVFVNYDTEYDKLRRIILSNINDILSETEPTLQRILYDNLGNLSVFFGRKMTIDNLIPLSNSCFNKKDFMLRMECLRGIPYLGLRVGQQTLAKFLLITCTQLLYDSEEAVVFQMIDSLNKLLEFGLLSKADSLENLEKLLPFLLHPNTWIREGAMKYIKFVANPENKLLTNAETYCIIRPKLKQYLKKGEKVYEIYGDDLNLSKLKPPLSRQIYEQEIKGLSNSNIAGRQSVQPQPQPTAEVQQLSESDKEAKSILSEVLHNAKLFHQSFKRERLQKDIEQDYNDDFKKKKDKTKTYRVIPSTIVGQLGGANFGNSISGIQSTINGRQKTSNDSNENNYQKKIIQDENELDLLANDFREQMNSQEYLDQNYYGVTYIPLTEIDRDNYGLNKRVLQNSSGMLSCEFDFMLQGLNIVPEDPELPLVQYKNHNLFQHLSVQGILVGSQLSVEQVSQQPQQIPQFGKTAKTLQVPIASGSNVFYTLGQQKHRFPQWRPSGRLITTLYEHKNAVNALAITDDSQFFFTGSKLDNLVNIWKTKDIETDVTSHSSFSIKCKRQVNSITTIENSNYFAVACSQGCIDIYQMGRVENEYQSNISDRRLQTTASHMHKQASQDKGQQSIVILGQQEPNHTSIIKTIEKRDEGDITLCTNMILPIQQQHLLAYVTQRGSLYFHDLRSRFDVSSQFELFGCQRGMATCMTLGQDPYQLYFGTIGGYVMIYDVRYNVISSFEKHFTRAPINSIAAFNPGRVNLGNLNRSDYSSPLALVSSGTSNYEVSLLNLATSDVEILLTVDDKRNKDNIVQTLPQVPSYLQETSEFYEADGYPFQRRNYNNSSLFRRYIQSNRNSQHFLSLLSLQQQQLVKNLDEEWLKHSKNRYMMVKTGYESSNACRKVFVPRKHNSMLHNPETVSYAITGGNDRKIRLWDFSALKRKSYQVNTPNDDECQYSEEFQGDTIVVQEKVLQFKQFPQINSYLASKQFEAGNQSNSNFQPYQNSTYYSILGGLMTGNENLSSGDNSGGQGLRTSSFQNDQDIVYNFNGLSEWQHFNGINYGLSDYHHSGKQTSKNDKYLGQPINQGVGGGPDASGGSSQDNLYRDSQNVSHSDCILELGMLELNGQDPILISCGRDGLVKLWR